jgi:hypothetical protein
LIVGVADDVVVPVLFVIRLFVSVFVELIVGTVTHSTAITPAETLVSEVSVACQSSMAVFINTLPLSKIDIKLELATPELFTDLKFRAYHVVSPPNKIFWSDQEPPPAEPRSPMFPFTNSVAPTVPEPARLGLNTPIPTLPPFVTVRPALIPAVGCTLRKGAVVLVGVALFQNLTKPSVEARPVLADVTLKPLPEVRAFACTVSVPPVVTALSTTFNLDHGVTVPIPICPVVSTTSLIADALLSKIKNLLGTLFIPSPEFPTPTLYVRALPIKSCIAYQLLTE